jgi:dCTP deaminase
MILSDRGIVQALDDGSLEIDPAPTPEQYTTSAVDLAVGNNFMCWDREKLKLAGFTPTLNLAEQKFLTTAHAFLVPMPLEPDGSFLFHPFEDKPRHVLVMTRERVHLKLGSKLAARVEGRSSLARIGLTVHLTAPTIHAGFNAPITLEMINYSPFTLKIIPNKTFLCQLIIERLESDPTGDIKTSFQGQKDASGAH